VVPSKDPVHLIRVTDVKEIAFTGTPVTDIQRAQKVVRIFGR